MRVLLAAGGTAGHINPALAIADKIKEIFPDAEILFSGTPTGLEARLVSKSGYAFAPIKTAGFQRKINIKNIGRNAKAAYYYLTAKTIAKKLIKDFNPDIVIGTGGYVTAPILSAASALNVKTATHESNSLPGISTKMLSKTADIIFLGNEDAIKHLDKKVIDKCVVSGNPLRSQNGVSKPLSKREAREKLGLPAESMTILSFGGSLGANKITEAVIGLLKWEKEKGDVNHIHAYGGNGRELFAELLKKNEKNEKGERLIPSENRTIFTEYIHNMYDCMVASDLVISRSGAMTQTELKAFGRASIQIPWSGAAENHQYFNALTMKENGAAVIIEDDEINAETLIKEASALYNDRIKLAQMEINASKMASPNAAGIIVSKIIDILKD